MTVDLGTGDGLFIYNSARQDPHTFFIGIDANRAPLQKISERIYRKPAKGGAANVMFVQAAVESLPAQLTGVATEVYVNFPWGSLLAAVVGKNIDGLRNLKQICAPEGMLRVMIGVDEERDRTQLEKLDLPALSLEYLKTTVAAQYRSAGFEIIECEVGQIGVSDVKTSWSRRLSANRNRSVIRLLARAVGE